jgi:hypothetical protein
MIWIRLDAEKAFGYLSPLLLLQKKIDWFSELVLVEATSKSTTDTQMGN